MLPFLLIMTCLAMVLLVALLFPDAFQNMRESIFGSWLVGLSGVFMGLMEYLTSDTVWHDLVDPAYLPYFLVGLGVLGVMLRNINQDRHK